MPGPDDSGVAASEAFTASPASAVTPTTGAVVLPSTTWKHHVAKNVNRSGVAVGSGSTFYGNSSFGGAGLVWCGGTGLDLNSMVRDSAGVTIQSANAVNASGQIAATGVDADKRTVSVVLTPSR